MRSTTSTPRRACRSWHPELDGIPCIGASANACFALAESQGLGTPEVVPRTSISASP
ncbi:hypothetical protein C731_3796 [Mycolicibacterium hassiacum DSM 44199]|uniref:Uncharacterized protein n=1 Tax=Mycolicibacterium hassiacum (strain DSM 44199 / CIP 105218 / JCM 12690 / 3849) TaxID=1122247 RepID=K5BJ11_MYCHD|nr:hypothetical protein [Mycolicibacterium hassiacum]EKF22304.1 hypothetical protein C731_3796 [Mycolicibacterium hassiacum DSM 44199]